MRVVILTASFHPTIGGAETYALRLAEGLSRLEHDVLVITDTPPGDVHDDHKDYAFSVVRLGQYQSRLADDSKLLWEELAFCLSTELESAIRRFAPDVLVSNSLDTAIQAAFLRRVFGMPWAAAFHEHAPQDEPMGVGHLAVVHGDLRPDAVLAGSEFYASRARAYGSDKVVHLIHHGVEIAHVEQSVADEWRRRYAVASDDLLIVSVGRLKARKGHLELIEAFAAQQSSSQSMHLVIAGTVSSASPAYFAQLRATCEALQCADSVHFDHGVSADQVPYLMAAADIVAQPSHEEGLGLAVLEGMAARRPVLTTYAPGIDEIVTDESVALRVMPRDPGSLALALRSLIEDADLRSAYAERGFDHVRSLFSFEVATARTARVLEQLIDQGT